jgi:hypothetical protein
VELSPLLLRLFIGLMCQPLLTDDDDFGAVSEMDERQGKR